MKNSAEARRRGPAPELILASASAGRAELLEEAGFAFEVRPAPEGVEEAALDEAGAVSAGELALSAARAKAGAVAAVRSEAVVLAADTLVRAADGGIVGKGRSEEESRAILRRLAGTRHQVISGAVLAAGAERWETVSASELELAAMSERQIEAYVRSGRSVGASGGYRIQRDGADPYLRLVRGSLSNVVGLPMEEIIPALAGMGIFPRSGGKRIDG